MDAGVERKGNRVAEASESEPPLAPPPRESQQELGGATTVLVEEEEDVASRGRKKGEEQGLRLVGAGIAARGTQTDDAHRPHVAGRIVLAPVDDSDHAGTSCCKRTKSPSNKKIKRLQLLGSFSALLGFFFGFL